MTYQVLARKWRPQTFNQVVGQDQTVQALSNALDQQTIHHAYLFTGTRGVGKTTIARILAKCLNCEQSVSSQPCGECDACMEINANRFVDLIEVDAASRTKVEDTREILENVQYAATKGRYKVYLIDEVHMLSGHSFNALLKTLEEPPSHVIFLLATTDPQKLPATILSRCLQFHLMHVSMDDITNHLSAILDKEGKAFDTDALSLIAQAACGSIRDALSLLDQALAYGNGSVRTDDTKAMLGTIDQSDLLRILTALSEQKGDALVAAIDQLEQKGVQMDHALADLLRLLHQITLIQVAGSSAADDIVALAKAITPADCQLYYQIGLQGQQELPFAPTTRIGFEMTLLRMLAFVPLDAAPQTGAAPQASSTKRSPPTSAPPAAAKASRITKAAATQQRAPAPQATGTPLDLYTPDITWDQILPNLALTGPTQAFANHCQLIDIDQQKQKMTLALSPAHKPLLNKKHTDRIEIALKNQTGAPYSVDVRIEEASGTTPHDLEKVKTEARLSSMEAKIKQDENVKQIMQTFSATIVEGSMKASESSIET